MSSSSSELPLVDLHSHLVPGVDDGAISIHDTLEGIGRMVQRGVRTMVATPHLDGSLTRDPDLLEARLAGVDAAFGRAEAAVRQRHPAVRLLRGHEVRLDSPNPDLSDQRIRLGSSNYVLVEWPELRIPPETLSVLRQLGAEGVRPLIAHPERYRGYGSEIRLAGRWREAGARLQVNFGSLADRYGPEAKSNAVRLLRRGWVDCLATDFHARPHLRLYIRAAYENFDRLGAREAWELLTRTNPGRICRGEEPLPVPPVRWEGGLLRRMRSLLRS